MPKKDRYLHFGNLELDVGNPIVGTCNTCDCSFSGRPNPGETTEDVLVRMRAEFEAHNCHEDVH